MSNNRFLPNSQNSTSSLTKSVLKNYSFEDVIKELKRKEDKKTNEYVLENYVSKIRYADIHDLPNILMDLLNQNIYPNAFIFNQILIRLKEKSSQYFHIAKDFFAISASTGMIDPITYNSILEIANKEDDFKYMTEIIFPALYAEKFLRKNFTAEPIIFNIVMKRLGENGFYDHAKKLYEYLHLQEHETKITRGTIVDIAIQNDDLIYARKVFWPAVIEHDQYHFSIPHYMQLVTEAAKKNDIECLKEVRQAIAKHQIHDFRLFSALIHSYAQLKEIELAEEIFQKEIVASENIPADFLSAMMDAYVLNNQFEKAEQIYNSNLHLFSQTFHAYGRNEIDLHRFGYGAAYLFLKKFIKNTISNFQNNEESLQIRIIYGRQTHSAKRDSIFCLKNSVTKCLSDMEHKYKISHSEIHHYGYIVLKIFNPKQFDQTKNHHKDKSDKNKKKSKKKSKNKKDRPKHKKIKEQKKIQKKSSKKRKERDEDDFPIISKKAKISKTDDSITKKTERQEKHSESFFSSDLPQYGNAIGTLFRTSSLPIPANDETYQHVKHDEEKSQEKADKHKKYRISSP